MSDKKYTHHSDQTKLAEALLNAKPWFEKNGTALIYGVAAVLAIAAAIVFMRGRPSPTTEASASLLQAIQNPGYEEYQAVADDFPDTAIGVWTRLAQADQLSEEALRKMFTDRTTALEDLDKAEATYKRLADRNDIDTQIKERVLIGLARLTEARCDGTVESADAAIAAWKRVLSEFEDSIIKEHAEERVARLGSDTARSFYTWFHAQNPSPDDEVSLPDSHPSLPGDLSLPDLQIPNVPDMLNSEPEFETDPNDSNAPKDESSEKKTADDTAQKDSVEPAEKNDPETPDKSAAPQSESKAPESSGSDASGSDASDTAPEPESTGPDVPDTEGAVSSTPDKPADEPNE